MIHLNKVNLGTVDLMSFLPKPGEKFEDDDLYEKSGDEDDRLRGEYYLVYLVGVYHESIEKIYENIHDKKILAE